ASDSAAPAAASVPAALRPTPPETTTPSVEGVSVSDLPLEEREERERARTAPVVRPPVARVAPAPAPATPKVWLEETATPAEPGAAAPTLADTAAEGETQNVLPVSPYTTQPGASTAGP